MEFHSVGTELLHAESQKDMKKLIVTFQNFTNTPKNQLRSTNHVTHTLKLLLNPEHSNHSLVMLVWDTIISANGDFPVHFHAFFTLQTCMSSSKRSLGSHTVIYVSYSQLTVAKILHWHCLWIELHANNVHWQRQKQWHVTHLLLQVHSSATTQNMTAQHTGSSHISLRRTAFLLHFRNGRPNDIRCCLTLVSQF